VDVAHALVRAASRLFSTPGPRPLPIACWKCSIAKLTESCFRQRRRLSRVAHKHQRRKKKYFRGLPGVLVRQNSAFRRVANSVDKLLQHLDLLEALVADKITACGMAASLGSSRRATVPDWRL